MASNYSPEFPFFFLLFMFYWQQETIAKMHEQFGREIRVFETLSLSSSLNAATNKGTSKLALTFFRPFDKCAIRISGVDVSLGI